MRRPALLAGALFGLASAMAGERPQLPPPIFPTDLDVVNVTVAVRDSAGHLVLDLDADDFTILEDGRPQNIQVFGRALDPGQDETLALDLGLLMDTSQSMLQELKLSQEAATRFLQAIPRARELITPSLMKLIDAEAKAAQKRRGPPRLDTDPFIDAQDSDIKSFKVEVQEVGRARAVATVTFKNEAAAHDDPIILVLVKIGDAWRIDDFSGAGGSLRKFLSRKPRAG